MKKKDYIICILFLLPAVAGWFIGGYGGGLISGIFVTLLVAGTIGKIAAHKTMARIDRNTYNRNISEMRNFQ